MSTWQTMESAPKDGKVIVWLADEGFPVMASWRVIDKGTEDEWEGFWIWEMDSGGIHDITHWMPLPSPPSDTNAPKETR
jgi:hypothetical protein